MSKFNDHHEVYTPIFRFNNMDESFSEVFYLLYGILVTYKDRNKFASGIKAYSDKVSKGIE